MHRLTVLHLRLERLLEIFRTIIKYLDSFINLMLKLRVFPECRLELTYLMDLFLKVKIGINIGWRFDTNYHFK